MANDMRYFFPLKFLTSMTSEESNVNSLSNFDSSSVDITPLLPTIKRPLTKKAKINVNSR